MANFIDRLSEKVEEKKSALMKTLRPDADVHERPLAELVRQHWHRLPPLDASERRPAFAVDGSRAVRHLVNGAYLFVAQALIIGERANVALEDTRVDIEILPGIVPTPFIERYAELMMHHLEISLASQHAAEMPMASVIFLDGALYGQLPQLYPFREMPPDIPNLDLPQKTLDEYLRLFAHCAARNLTLISIAKTSRQATHTRVWWQNKYGEDLPKEKEIADSECLYRWTENAAGFSTPILFGKRAFEQQPEAVVFGHVQDLPAIASFFVRLDDFDDVLRVDVPATCLGRSETMRDIETNAEILLDQPADLERVTNLLALLKADYGGPDVYNALLYSVDRQVRLRQDTMDQVYLTLIQSVLGLSGELRLDRSERRFH
ncbi:MAG: DNA double-strand break repair nuclease NurA [Anaerolineae bacterium]|nr:DNA double-strand break repair nuclease NurA [Anaerolineae bacterium]